MKEKEDIVIDDSWTELETDVPEITVKDLRKDTSYSFIIRADSKRKGGHRDRAAQFQHQEVPEDKGQ